MARHWKLPESVSNTIRVDQPSGSPDEILLSDLVSFSHSLTTAVYRGTPERQNRKSAHSSHRIKTYLGSGRIRSQRCSTPPSQTPGTLSPR